MSINYSTPNLLTHTHLTLFVSFCRREGSKQKMKSIGLVQGKAKVHSSVNQSLTRRQSSRKSNMKSPLSEDEIRADPLSSVLVQAKYASRGPRTRYGWTHYLRSLRNDSSSRCPNFPPAPSSKTPWKISETCK